MIREASSYIRLGKRIQKPTATQYAVRHSGTPNTEWDVSIKSFPSGLRKPCGKEGRKNVRSRADEKQNKTKQNKKTTTFDQKQLRGGKGPSLREMSRTPGQEP